VVFGEGRRELREWRKRSRTEIANACSKRYNRFWRRGGVVGVEEKEGGGGVERTDGGGGPREKVDEGLKKRRK
jgi:hypothetical protein